MIDAWNPRTPSAQEFKREPMNGIDALLDVIKSQGERLRESTSNLLGSAGIRLKPGRMVVEQSLDVEGELTVTGNTTIAGTLSLPAGIIDNEALASPVKSASRAAGVNNFAIGTAATVRSSMTFTVPAGFTTAIVMSVATAMGQNASGSMDYLYVQSVVNGLAGGELYSAAPNGTALGISVPYWVTLSGLTGGGTLTVACTTRTSFNTWPATTSNQANIYATVLFTR